MAGFLVFNPEIFDRLAGDSTVLERGPLEGLAEAGQLMAYQYDGFWQCMDTLRDKLYLEELLTQKKAPWKIW